MKREILIENAKGWNLIANGLKCGINIKESLALVEERCNSAELRPLFGALISDCETHRGVPPPKTAKYDLIPKPIYELIFLGWATGMLDNVLSKAVIWLRAQLVFENDPAFLTSMTEALLASYNLTHPVNPVGDLDQILNDYINQLNKKSPVLESPDGTNFRNLASQIEKGVNPDSLIELKTLSSLEQTFYQQGYNSGTLDFCLRRLADVIDFDQSNLF